MDPFSLTGLLALGVGSVLTGAGFVLGTQAVQKVEEGIQTVINHKDIRDANNRHKPLQNMLSQNKLIMDRLTPNQRKILKDMSKN